MRISDWSSDVCSSDLDSTHDGVHSRHRRIGLAAMEWISSRSSSAPEGPEPVESSRQIIDQILACLKTRMDADQAAFLQRRATELLRGPGGNNKNYKPTQVGTELKQRELIEEKQNFLSVHIV